VISTREIDDNFVFGRMSESMMDPSDFDALPRRVVEIDPRWDGKVETVFDGDEAAPVPFQSPAESALPILSHAVRRFQALESPPRVVRIDTEESYGEFVCERAVRELDRRVRELRALVEKHLADGHGPPGAVLREWDVIGAADAVEELRNASSADDVRRAMPTVPLSLPDYASGKIHCWRDGDRVVCSIHFEDADGNHRVATSAARPAVDVEEVAAAAERAGMNPAEVLGAVDDLAEVACARRLARDTARAAVEASSRPDVVGSDRPVLVGTAGEAGAAPLAALMHLQQRCDVGDRQACREMEAVRAAAESPAGRHTVAPLLAEVDRMLASRRALSPAGSSFLDHHVNNAGWF
jgi:hypothetical protein